MELGTACEQFLDHCRFERNLSDKTLLAYRGDLTNFDSYARQILTGEQTVDLIDHHLLRGYVKHLSDDRGLCASSTKRRLASLRCMFRWLEVSEFIGLSPFHKLNLRLQLPKRLPRNLSRREIRRLTVHLLNQLGLSSFELSEVSYADVIQTRAQMNILSTLVSVELMYVTGIRVGELTRIRIRDIDLREGVLRIHGKGDRERRVFITRRELEDLIKFYLTCRTAIGADTEILLVNSRGTSASTQYIRAHLTIAAKEANVGRHVTPHMIRHTSATQLLEAGVDIRCVQRLLGHQSIATTQIYASVSDKMLKRTMRQAAGKLKVI